MFLQYHTAFYTVIITDNEKITGVVTCTGKEMCMSDSERFGNVNVICKNSLPVDTCFAIVRDIIENLPLQDIRQKYGYLDGSLLDCFVTNNYEKIRAFYAGLTDRSYETIESYYNRLLEKETLIRQNCKHLVNELNQRRHIDNIGELQYASRFVSHEVYGHMALYQNFVNSCNMDFSDLPLSESCWSLT
ncbi:hypothetical protein GUITHDRAFT_117693 [Guillardia theta CCMP2712]|uniref:Uncharacterized protein n=1 Tax=Guillardia theta (strain CCMP2712) TaxID=905079 RepID=L1IK42_GUITC|nr:hypothetical protein GUITHDRAFT_117693 [Guillardia theta CCMP2712]EKX36175.1 hypothetical protein GUITHDRAFT_117693 [Guillardia theta CCMP2712]|eukprot:XP_005823155.1 hypothetical protein GUITHDRAFT_117693 [Guillardia theta CCMP2712]